MVKYLAIVIITHRNEASRFEYGPFFSKKEAKWEIESQFDYGEKLWGKSDRPSKANLLLTKKKAASFIARAIGTTSQYWKARGIANHAWIETR